jgi:hypothetical protein
MIELFLTQRAATIAYMAVVHRTLHVSGVLA